MEASAAVWRRSDPTASCSRSRMTSDFEILRPRDSASISATSDSGNRTVRLFIAPVYYVSATPARHTLVSVLDGISISRFTAESLNAEHGAFFGLLSHFVS